VNQSIVIILDLGHAVQMYYGKDGDMVGSSTVNISYLS
jgi:hypothetical protein